MSTEPIDAAEELATVRRALAELSRRILEELPQDMTPERLTEPLRRVEAMEMLVQVSDALERLTTVVEKHEAESKKRSEDFEAFMFNARYQLAKALASGRRNP